MTVALPSFSKEKLYPPLFDAGGLVYFGPMFDFLIGATPDGKLSTASGALESYQPSADAKVWTLTLKPGIKWHDGSDVTSADLEFTLTEFGKTDSTCSACGSLRSNLASVDVVDGRTVKLNLKNPDVNIPVLLGPIEGDIVLLPKKHVEMVGRDGFETKPMGSGPWKFVSRKIGEGIEFEANTSYWNKERTAKFQTLKVVLAPDQNTRMAMLKRGEADLIAITPDAAPTLKSDGFKVFTVDNTLITEVLFLQSWDTSSLASKVDFRKALSLALDMDKIVESFYPGDTGKRHTGGAVPFSPISLGVDTNLKPYPYNPAEAKKMLDAAGYTGQTVVMWNFVLPDGPEMNEVNETIAGYWQKVGIKVQIVPIEWAAFRDRLTADPQRFEATPAVNVMAWPTSARPSVLNNLRPLMLSKQAGGSLGQLYWDPAKMDGYYKELAGTIDPAKMDARLREINREIYQEYWSLPIAMKHSPFAAGPKIEGWQPIAGISKVLVYETLVPKK